MELSLEGEEKSEDPEEMQTTPLPLKDQIQLKEEYQVKESPQKIEKEYQLKSLPQELGSGGLQSRNLEGKEI